jgi:hypothetical protein
MQLEIFVLCDKFAMGKSPQGQMVWSIISPFDCIDLSTFPGRISFTIVTAIRFFAEEHGDHKIQICMIDADLRQLIEPATKKPIGISKNFNVPDTSKPHCQFEVWSAGLSGKNAGTGGAWIEKAGEYFFDLKVDGKNTGRLPIHILPARQT